MIHDIETNSRVDRMIRKMKNLSCSYCPPHRHENAGDTQYYKRNKCWKLKRTAQPRSCGHTLGRDDFTW